MGGRGPSSPNGPNGPLRGTESTQKRSTDSWRRAPEAPRFAWRLKRQDLQRAGSAFVQIPCRGEGRFCLLYTSDAADDM
eukprot:10420486-Alexandrium_andersonii.AAC.1